MNANDYTRMYNKIFKIIGNSTPLKADCGLLCGNACCKGDDNIGMILFPFEETNLKVKITQSGERLAVCSGICDRDKRPLSCRIFPFFPTIDKKGRIFVEKDYRGGLLCPLLEHIDEISFNPKFFKALKRVGKILAKNPRCREFLYKTTEEIDLYYKFLSKE